MASQKQVTKINKMEMKGFKSFANKVDILFGDEFNCILGPNGSGKSNVLDALCFVLGKAGAKGLRAEKTANLIYNGGKSKNPAKSGEVSIYFDNSHKTFPKESKEIKISRIVKSSGTSVYKINDETVTRQQITDLLGIAHINPDGYNIILQGDIVRLVEMSPNDRRAIIEEISGISIYEDKKAKAQRELEKVEQQLKESDIVLAERGTYLKELKKERDQALKFKELDEKIKRNKATVLTRKISEREKKIKELQTKIDKEQGKVDEIQAKIDSLKEQILGKKKEIDDVSREVEEKGEKEQVELMRTVENLKVDLAVKKQRQDQLNTELSRIADRRKELDGSMNEAASRVAKIEKEINAGEKKIAARKADEKKLDDKIEAFRKKHDVASASDVDKQIEEIDKSAEKIQEEIQKLREQQQNLFRDKDKAEYQIQLIDDKVNKVLEAQKVNKSQLNVLKSKQSELKKVEQELSKALDRGSAIVPELQTAKGKLFTRREELSKIQARQASIQENVAGNLAVSKLLELRKTNKKIHGTLSELGTVSTKFSLALEIAAGARLRSVVVEDDKTAQECIEYLKKNRLGVATLLPLNKLQARPIPANVKAISGSGVHGLALDLVKFDKKFQIAFQHALGSTLVVENITTARKIGIGMARMVTTEGDLVEATGAMTGGHRQRKGTGRGFQEQELTTNMIAVEKEVADYESLVSRLESEQGSLNTMIDDFRNRRHTLETEVLALERELHIDGADVNASKDDKAKLRDELKDLDKKIDDVVSEISSSNKELAKLKMDRASLREKISAMRSPQILAELNTFEEQKRKVGEEIVQIKTQMDSFVNQIESIHKPELENIKKIFAQQEKERKGFEKESNDLKEEVKNQTAELKEKQKAEEAFRKQFKDLFAKRNKLQNDVESLEDKTIAEEERIRKSEHSLNASNIQMASFKAELAGIQEEFKEFHDVEPYKTKPDAEIQKEIRQFERMVEDLGAVNMKALEIYEKVEKEYESLVEKKEVLVNEREDVIKMMNVIDSKKRELFMKTFDVVEKNFKGIFGQLLTKGEAFLELETPEDPFAGGLNVRVRLSGTKFLDIRSLSGGEKTLTALAFLFSIQEHQPASFYILDEVDAALDKKNSDRLAKLVRSYSDRAQYIIISHNDNVISEADNLYGVSMNEHGETQVTSLKI